MTDVIEKPWTASEWRATETPGLDFAVLRQHDSGGATFFLRFAEGVTARPHTHPAGEELYVVSGDITIGGRRLGPGDFLYTLPDASHDAQAHRASVILLHAPQLPVFL